MERYIVIDISESVIRRPYITSCRHVQPSFSYRGCSQTDDNQHSVDFAP
jgi:hypothetical protein